MKVLQSQKKKFFLPHPYFKALALLTLIVVFPPHLLASAEEAYYQHVYLGVSGPSGSANLGVLGHSFIVFSEKEEEFFNHNSVTFQYAISFSDLSTQVNIHNINASDYIQLLKDINRFPLIVDRTGTSDFINRYRVENRITHLYKLEVEEDVVRDLYEIVENDHENGVQDINRENINYHLLKANCASFLISRVNEVLERYGVETFASPWNEDVRPDWRSIIFRTRESISTSVPLLWIHRISEHPKTHAVPLFFSSRLTELIFELDDWSNFFFQIMTEECGKEEDLIRNYIELFQNPAFRRHKPFLNLLTELIDGCEDSIKFIALQNFTEQLHRK